MKLNDFNFDLPPDLIAKFPLAKRSGSRLLTLNNPTGEISHGHFSDIIDQLNEHDLLIFNDTKVIPARLFGKKKTGGLVEILIERILDNQRILTQMRVSKPLKIGDKIYIGKDICFMLRERCGAFFELLLEYPTQIPLIELIEQVGEIPLPPYLHRSPNDVDKIRYQTIYAQHNGSVAAPTAGLHFDDSLMASLKTKKIEMGFLTLHIGAGTFAPIRTENIKDHKMHSERFSISERLCAQIKAARKRGGRIIAVGTTTLRALESASRGGEIQPYCGETNIFIYPGYHFNCVDVLITNLHLPSSTLILLVAAFAGIEHVRRAYQAAIEQRYRFYSYGDAMWVTQGKCLS